MTSDSYSSSPSTNAQGKRTREVTVKIISVHLPIILSVVFFDQAAKYFVLARGLVTSCNVGFAFGILPFSNLLSVALTLLVLTLVGYLLIHIVILRPKAEESNTVFGLALIFGGGLSNLIDRFTRGCVVDFIQWSSLNRLPLPEWLQLSLTRWPSFNLADAAITGGVGILILSMLKDIYFNEFR